METDANIRYRVITGVTSTRGDPPFLRLIHAFLALSRSVDVGLSSSQVLQYDDLCAEMLSIEILEQRHAAVQEASRREVNRYAAKQEGIECAIATAEDDIKQAKATLLEAQVLRSNLVAYERNRVVMMQYVSRAACTAECQRAIADAAAITADCAQADMRVQVLRRRVATFLHVLEMLQHPLLEVQTLAA